MPSSHAAVRTDLDRQIDDKLARDPIAQAIPMLFDYTKEKQLETLYWLKYAPRQKLAAFFPRLGEGAELSIHEREQLALDLIDGFITDLEREGVKAHRF